MLTPVPASSNSCEAIPRSSSWDFVIEGGPDVPDLPIGRLYLFEFEFSCIPPYG
jgi:hypothetical protein